MVLYLTDKTSPEEIKKAATGKLLLQSFTLQVRQQTRV